MTDNSGRDTLGSYNHVSQRTCIVGIHARSPLVTLVVVSRKKTGGLDFKTGYSSSVGSTNKCSIQVNSNNMSRDVPL